MRGSWAHPPRGSDKQAPIPCVGVFLFPCPARSSCSLIFSTIVRRSTWLVLLPARPLCRILLLLHKQFSLFLPSGSLHTLQLC